MTLIDFCVDRFQSLNEGLQQESQLRFQLRFRRTVTDGAASRGVTDRGTWAAENFSDRCRYLIVNCHCGNLIPVVNLSDG